MSTRSALFIDKISLTFDVDLHEQDNVVSGLFELSHCNLVSVETNTYSDLLKSYSHVFKIHFGGQQSCTVQVSPRKPGNRFMRLEWNPNNAAKVCQRPAHQIINVMRQVVPSFSPDLIILSNITRLDLSFDLRRIPIDYFFVFTQLRKPKSRRYTQVLSDYERDGRLNSLSIGRPGGDQYLLIYDKTLEMRNRQIGGFSTPQATSPQASHTRRIEVKVTRFELRLSSIGNLADLGNMENPFSRYSVRSFNNAEKVSNKHEWQWLIDSCRVRGAQAALSLVSDRRTRTRYRDALRELNPPTWWNPQAIWAEMPSAIRRALGLEA